MQKGIQSIDVLSEESFDYGGGGVTHVHEEATGCKPMPDSTRTPDPSTPRAKVSLALPSLHSQRSFQ